MRLFLLLQPLICVAQWHKRAAVDLAVSLGIWGGGHVLMGTGWEVSKCLLEVLEVLCCGDRELGMGLTAPLHVFVSRPQCSVTGVRDMQCTQGCKSLVKGDKWHWYR